MNKRNVLLSYVCANDDGAEHNFNRRTIKPVHAPPDPIAHLRLVPVGERNIISPEEA